MKKKFSAIQFIVLGYLITIVAGTLLLCLPFASKAREFTNLFDAFFTATSATCVTGLVVTDTFTHWSLFGQIVILTLIQIGGLGFMTIISLIFLLFKRQIGIFERVVLMQSAGSYNLSGIVKLIKKIIIITAIFEGLGAAIMSIRFIPMLGVANGIYYSVFHSISAFCNAGFDLMGRYGQFSSLTSLYNDPLICLTISALIIVGGMGFIAWSDLVENKWHFKRYQLHTKVVLVYNTSLILLSAVLFFGLEYNAAFADMDIGTKILSSVFQAVTPRTAGFNTVPYEKLSEGGTLLTVLLMFIGGNPGSTAGGVKTTTIIIVYFNLITSAKSRTSINIFKRNVNAKLAQQASSLFLTYLTAILFSTIFLLALEPYSLKEILFEVTSAIGTVGLSFGITPSLGYVSKTVLIFLMFAGRVGAFSLFSVFFTSSGSDKLVMPEGKILIG